MLQPRLENIVLCAVLLLDTVDFYMYGSMSFNSLHPEIWAKIVDYLKVPVPSPLSGCNTDIIADAIATRIRRVLDGDKVGQVSRRDIRQGDLATLMRTSTVSASVINATKVKRADGQQFQQSRCSHPISYRCHR